ncbi:hypothetical protein [Rhizobium viscosum]|uniref:Uncharacterized protein n=1 Tax=Rhizobium viscosum TaxID=1673 RepID=A0ABR9IIW2_RHIVS|nr:hypothetical protein [Rhizobium viscosum]MBE1503103.1 hypothetical protein [Rhizobium viscosum]
MPVVSTITKYLSRPLQIFISAATDIILVFQSSIFIGIFVAFLYLLATLFGIWIGDTLNDLLEIPLTLISLALPTPTDMVFDIVSYLFLMWLGLTLMFFLVRTLLRALVWCAYSLKLSGTVSALVVIGTLCTAGFLFLLMWPDEYGGDWLTITTGYALMLALIALSFALWTWNRYRVNKRLKARLFDHEVGGSLYHLSSFRDFSDLRTI